MMPSSRRLLLSFLFCSACSSSDNGVTPQSEASTQTTADSGSEKATGTDATREASATDAAIEASGDDAANHLGLGAPDCANGCCRNPQASTACTPLDEGTVCNQLVECDGGLELLSELRCAQGTWVKSGGVCPADDGGVAENGCPASPPMNSADCHASEGQRCQYVLHCPNTCEAGPAKSNGSMPASDASSTVEAGAAGTASLGTGCVSASSVGSASCTGGKWVSALRTCH